MSTRTEYIGLKSRIPACSKALLTGVILSLSVPAWAASSAQPAASISVKVDAPGAALVAGSATQFVVRVGNHGVASGGDNRVLVAPPQGLQTLTWSCSASSGSQCANASGSGALDESLQGLAPNSSLDYVFRAEVSASAPAIVDIVARATLAASARCASAETAPCQSRLSLATGPGVMLDVRSQRSSAVPGQQFRYTIVASTVSTRSNAEGSVLRSPLPKGLNNSSWSCRSNVGACLQASGQGAIHQVLGNFSEGSISFDVTATVAIDAPAEIVQTAVVVPPYGGSCAVADNGSMRFHSSPCTARNVLATSASIVVSSSEDYLADASSIATRFVLDNNGNAADGSVVDAKPGVDVSRLDWTCVGQGATCPQSSGTGAIHQIIASWPTSGRLIYDLVSQVASSATSEAKNSLVVTPSFRGVCAASGRSGSCAAVYSIPTLHAGLKLSQRVDELGSRGGEVVIYRINVGNSASAAPAHDVVLHVPLPKGISAFESWTCEVVNAAATSCPAASGSGAIREVFAQLAPSSDLNYAIQARVAGHPPATVTSRATLTAPASAGLGCGATDTDSHACVARSQFSTVPVLALDQSILASTLAPGSMVDYFLEILNLGAKADLVQVRTLLPLGISDVSWDCSGLGMGCPVANGNGEVKARLAQMPSGSGVRFHLSGRVDNSQPESANSVLTAIPETGGRCANGARDPLGSAPCVDRVSSSYAPKLQLTQTADEPQLLRGGVANLTLIVKNLGGPALDARLALPLAAGIERSSWNCAGFGGAVCPQTSGSGAIDASIAILPFDAYLRYSIRSNLAIDASSLITSVATTTPGAKTLCANLGCSNTLSLPVTDVPSAHLQLDVAASARNAHPGASVDWSVDVRNLGSERAGRFSLSDAVASSGVTINGWTCAGAECPAAEGNGPMDLIVESLQVYHPSNSNEAVSAGRLHFVVSGTIDQHPDSGAELAIRVVPTAGDTCAPVSCVSSSLLPSVLRGQALITLDVSSNDFEAYPNSSITYNYTISNNGGADVFGTPVYTMDPAGIVSSSWTCASNAGATCPTIGSGSGPVNEVVPLLPIGSSVVFTVVATTDTTIPDALEFFVGANPDSGVLCNPSSCMTSLYLPNGLEQLDLSLVADVASIEPFSSINYTFVVSNSGPADSFGFSVAGLDSPSFTSSSWTCISNGKAGCPPSGTGQLNSFISYLGADETATYSIAATVGATLPASIDYQVQLSTSQGGTDSPLGGLNCVPASCGVSLTLPTGAIAPAMLSISKQADVATLTPGGSVEYTVRIANVGNVDATSFQFIDEIPEGLTSFNWTCASSSNTVCEQTSGTGSLGIDIQNLPRGASLIYTINATVSTTATGTVYNRAQLVGDDIQCNPSSCQAVSSLPLAAAPEILVTKSATPAAGSTVSPGEPITWTLSVLNSGGQTTAALTLRDVLPSSVSGISVAPGPGVTCNDLSPAPGTTLTCTIRAGFSGEANVLISATVAAESSGAVVNSVSATGVDDIVCDNCSVSNPVGQAIDVALLNPRPFSAAGIAGTLVDLVNLSPTSSSMSQLSVTPVSSLRLLSTFASNCTTATDDQGNVSVACPTPPETQGIQCSGATCTVGQLSQGGALTVFVALNAAATATLQISAPGDSNNSNNSIELPAGGTP